VSNHGQELRDCTHGPGSIPPPFNQYDAYYIIPQSFKADLTALAMNDDETKIASSSTDLQLDLKALVENVEGEEVVVIETGMNPDGTRCLVGTGKKHRYWTIKDGLSEDDDFLFIHEDGWNKIMEW
jgi:ubiquitin carboxyl-terminal hydrolase 4/11/15